MFYENINTTLVGKVLFKYLGEKQYQEKLALSTFAVAETIIQQDLGMGTKTACCCWISYFSSIYNQQLSQLLKTKIMLTTQNTKHSKSSLITFTAMSKTFSQLVLSLIVLANMNPVLAASKYQNAELSKQKLDNLENPQGTIVAQAENCPYQVYNYADNIANIIVTDSKQMFFLSPIDLRTSVEECVYFPNEGAYIMHMRISWQHPWEQNKPYVAVVRVQSGNGSWSWNLKNWNYNLFEHLVTIGILNSISK